MSNYLTNKNTTMFDLYLHDVEHYRQLSEDEETTLLVQLKEGREDARTRLITSNLRLVFKIAEKLRYCGVDKEDLIQLGNLGLCKAARNFDPTKSTAFAPYAVKCIRGVILNELQSHGKDSMNATVWNPMPTHYDVSGTDAAISTFEGTNHLSIIRSRIFRALQNVSQKDCNIYFDYLYYPKDMQYITERWNVSQDYVMRVVKLCRSEISRNYYRFRVA